MVPGNVVDEVHISESLLKGKKALTESTTKQLNQLHDVWCKFAEQIADDEGLFPGLQKSAVNHLRNCTKLGSPWILRITPRITDHYTIMEVVGSPGSYGVVKKAMNKHTNKIVAVKCINKMRCAVLSLHYDKIHNFPLNSPSLFCLLPELPGTNRRRVKRPISMISGPKSIS